MTYSLIPPETLIPPPETLIPGKLLKCKLNKSTFIFGTTFPGGYRHVCAGEVFLLVRLEGYSIELLSPDGHMGYLGWDSRCWEIIP